MWLYLLLHPGAFESGGRVASTHRVWWSGAPWKPFLPCTPGVGHELDRQSTHTHSHTPSLALQARRLLFIKALRCPQPMLPEILFMITQFYTASPLANTFLLHSFENLSTSTSFT